MGTRRSQAGSAAPQSSKALFAKAVLEGWDKIKGGFYYTLDWNGNALVRDRYWWPGCEGVMASAFLNAIEADPIYERWYRRIWNFHRRTIHRS
jgi:sulfoquinovose isomerase